MPTRSLPPRPNLTQFRIQANELLRAHRENKPSALARIRANHPRLEGQSERAILDRPLRLADAQLVLAREYGFANWAELKHRVELGERIAQFQPHPRFGEAVAALKGGNIGRLRELLVGHPELVHARTNLDPPYGYFSGATLLHHVAGNPGGWEHPMPKNIVDAARLLLDAGADVNAVTVGPNGGTTMGLVITSKQRQASHGSVKLNDIATVRRRHKARLMRRNCGERCVGPDTGPVLERCSSRPAGRSTELSRVLTEAGYTHKPRYGVLNRTRSEAPSNCHVHPAFLHR